ncbi:MAG: hypothetical protein Fur0039_03330 [Rhodocyclaceae bacterium]
MSSIDVLASLARRLCLLFLVALAAVPATAAPAQAGLFAELHTGKGVITLRLDYERAPLTVMNFVALAEGSIEWIDEAGTARHESLYRKLAFHRVRDFMIQTGDPTGTGKGGSGRSLADEIDPALAHDKAGVVAMANRGPDTNSSQFFITKQPARWLDGHHTIFGEVASGLDVVSRITEGDRLEKIVILRRGAAARAFTPARAHELSAERLARLREAGRKFVPEPVSEPDPAKLPSRDQPVVSPGDFDFLVIGYAGMPDARQAGRVFSYDHDGAMEVAKKLVRLARARNADFGALIEKYSDMRRDTVTRGVADTPRQPLALREIFRLRPGQVSEPIDLPGGIYVFRRLPPLAAGAAAR